MAYAQRSITGLPPNLFSGGAVVINPNPVVDYANAVAARNQAKDEAFTKYYADLGNNLTPTGVHADDLPDILSKKSEWQNFNLSHRKTLKDPTLDNGADYATSNRLYNEALGTARKSQEKIKNLATIKSVIDDPKKSALLTDDAVRSIHNAGLRVNDNNYRPLDPSDIHFNPKPFDLNDQAKVSNVLKGFKPQQIPSAPVQDEKTGMQTINYTPKYDKDQLHSMYGLGASLYASHPGFKADVDKHADVNDPDYARLNTIYKQHFTPENGFNENIQTPEDMAAAKLIGLNPNNTLSPKVTPLPPNSQIAQRNKRDQAAFTSGLRLSNSEQLADHNFNNKLKMAQDKAGVDGFVDDRVHDALQKPVAPLIKADGTTIPLHVMETSSAIRNLFPAKTVNEEGKTVTVTPNNLRVSADGKYVYPMYNTSNENEQGKASVNRDLTKPFPIEEYKAILKKHKIGSTAPTTTVPKTNVEKTAEDLINKYLPKK